MKGEEEGVRGWRERRKGEDEGTVVIHLDATV